MLKWLLACTTLVPQDDGATTDDKVSTDDTTPPDSTPTTPDTAGTPTDTAVSTSTSAIEFDCDSIPFEPTSNQQIDGARGYHDLAFTPDGLVIGSGNGNTNLITSDYAGNTNLFVPGIGGLEQLAWLPNGDLAAASPQYGIVRIGPTGGYTVIEPNLHPYGLILGPDQQLYAATQAEIWRVDPDTGASVKLLRRGALDRGQPRVIAFGLGYTRMLIGTLGGSQGRIYALDLDANYDPVGDPYEFASGVGSGDYHDGLGVDLCGYLYIPDYSTSALYRVSPDGNQVQKLYDTGLLGGDYGHGLEWGSGIGGWRTDALYLPLPYGGNHVLELVIGAPSRDDPDQVAINLP
ncbi:MAG: hypothetical protein ABMB14_31495 [Myxococcota bacterium]